MAGSRAWFVYVADDDTNYAVELDEDSGSINTAGFEPYTAATPLDLPPQGFKMRYVNAVQTTGDGAGFRSRKFYCGNTGADLYDGTATTVEVNNLQYAVSSTRGEKSRKPKVAPTGLQGESSIVGEGTE